MSEDAPATPAKPARVAPGGNQTYNIFSGDANTPQPARRADRANNPTWKPSADSPFSASNDAPAARPGLAVRSNSATYKPAADSPFSKEPVAEKPRKPTKINSTSEPEPAHPKPRASAAKVNRSSVFSSDAQTADSAPAARPYKANTVSDQNPLSNTSAPEAPTPPRRVAKANVQSQSVDRKPSLSVNPSKSKSSIFTNDQPEAPAVRATPTFNSSADSPFSKGPEPPKVARPTSRVNQVSSSSPFVADNAPPTVHRPTAKANIQSSDSPFNSSAPAAAARPASTRQAPGGNQTFSLFE